MVTTEHPGHATELAAEVSRGRRRRPGRRRHLQRDRKRDPAGRPDGRPARRRVVGVRPPLGFSTDPIAAADAARRGDPGRLDAHGRASASPESGCSPSPPASASTPRRPRIVDRGAGTSGRATSGPATCACWRRRCGVLRKEGVRAARADDRAHRRRRRRTGARTSPSPTSTPTPSSGRCRCGPRPAPTSSTAWTSSFTRELRARDLWRLPVYGLIWPRHAGHGEPPRRLPARSAPLHHRVRRADRLPARRRVRRARGPGRVLLPGRRDRGARSRPRASE